ncbi:25304_t:CDS:10 [Dentiscutata erythropus]|uniref:25304_t:CDS:1 n=1 Tax=Dentiscutata erythropus TaxID=1348616 RepID=A0A9N9AUU6_9GLOM|nr:25304_t:CDS:10 [Dentiscutata erythropus]
MLQLLFKYLNSNDKSPQKLEIENIRVSAHNSRDFEKHEIIGRGGCAVVYSASFKQEKHALKSLNNNLSFDEKALKRVKRELKLHYEVDHPNVIKFFGISRYELERLSFETTVEFITNIPHKYNHRNTSLTENRHDSIQATINESKFEETSDKGVCDSGELDKKKLKETHYKTTWSMDPNIYGKDQKQPEFFKARQGNIKYLEHESKFEETSDKGVYDSGELDKKKLKDDHYKTTRSMDPSICVKDQKQFELFKAKYLEYHNKHENCDSGVLDERRLKEYHRNTAWSMDTTIYKTSHQQYEFFKARYSNSEDINEREKEYLLKMLQSKFDKLKVKNKEGEERQCEDCKNFTRAFQYCEFCIRIYLHHNFREWTGNDEIDKAIQDAQKNVMGPDLVIEFIPYERLKDIQYRTKGFYADIYNAVWIDGPFNMWNGKVLERIRNHNVILKRLKNSDQTAIRWFNEILSHLKYDKISSNIVRCYGITKEPDTGDFILVLNVMDFDIREFLEHLEEKNLRINWKDQYQIIYKISACLHEMHQEGLIHKDLHPGNVLLQGDYEIRISDLEHDIFLVNAIIFGLRPDIVYGTPPEYEKLMKQCWDAIPENRPDARAIYKEIYKLQQNLSNVIENATNAKIVTDNIVNDNISNIRIRNEHPNKDWSATTQYLSSGPKNWLKDNPKTLSSGPKNWLKEKQEAFYQDPKMNQVNMKMELAAIFQCNQMLTSFILTIKILIDDFKNKDYVFIENLLEKSKISDIDEIESDSQAS